MTFVGRPDKYFPSLKNDGEFFLERFKHRISMTAMKSLLWGLPRITHHVLSLRTFSVSSQTPLLNEALRHLPLVRLISEKGHDCGTMSGEQALRHAKHAGRDVMQVSVRPPEPPILRILDYAALEDHKRKHAYERRKAEKESRKLQRRENVLKKVRLSPATDVNDIAVKMRQAKQFLIDGYRVKVFMMFRRGQGGLQDNAKRTLINAAEELSKFGKVQGIPTSGLFEDLFRQPEQPVEDGFSLDGDDGEQVKKKPLEVLIYPLPRTERENISGDDAIRS